MPRDVSELADAFRVRWFDGSPRCPVCASIRKLLPDGETFCSARCTLIARRLFHTFPTPAEISERCEQIQAGWTDIERTQRRYGCADNVPILGIPAYRTTDGPLGMSIESAEPSD